MKRAAHIRQKDLIRYHVSGSQDTFVSDHLFSCERCRKNYVLLKSITDSSQLPQIEPSSQVLYSIFSEYENIARKPDKRKRPYITATVSFVIALSMVIFFMMQPVEDYLDLVKAAGEVSSNEKDIRKTPVVTGENSMAAIAYMGIVRIDLSENTELQVVQSSLKDGILSYHFSLTKGKITADFDKKQHPVSYIFEMPDSTVASRGTSFSIEVAEGSTKVTVTEGSVFLTNRHTGSTVITKTGVEYSIEKNATIEKNMNDKPAAHITIKPEETVKSTPVDVQGNQKKETQVERINPVDKKRRRIKKARENFEKIKKTKEKIKDVKNKTKDKMKKKENKGKAKGKDKEKNNNGNHGNSGNHK